MKTFIKHLTTGCFLFFAVNTKAQNDDAAELAKKLANPIASLISLPFQNNLDHGIGPLKGSRYTLNVQPVIPLKITPKLNLIARWVQPIISQYNISGIGKHESGFADPVISGFFSPSKTKNGFTWGIGPVILLPIGSNSFSANKFGIGPTVVALKQTNGWTIGALWNQLWAGPLSQMFTQPFVTYNWKSGAGLGANIEWTQNWTADNSNVWLNPFITGLTSLGKQKVSLSFGPRFNLAAPAAAKSKFGIRAGVALLFPK